MRLRGKWTGYKCPTALVDGTVFSHARPVFGSTCDSSFSKASYAPIRFLHGCESRLRRGISTCRLWRLSALSAPCEPPSAKRGWTRFFFPFTNFFASSSAFSHAPSVFGFTCDSSFSQAMLLRLLCYAQCASRLGRGISTCRLWRFSALSAPCEPPTAKRGWTWSFPLHVIF